MKLKEMCCLKSCRVHICNKYIPVCICYDDQTHIILCWGTRSTLLLSLEVHGVQMISWYSYKLTCTEYPLKTLELGIEPGLSARTPEGTNMD